MNAEVFQNITQDDKDRGVRVRQPDKPIGVEIDLQVL